MAEINLLPKEFKPDARIVNISKNLKKFSILGFLIFIIAVLFSAGSYFLLSTLLNTSMSRQSNLKTQIQNLSQTEQQLYLVKDRLDKIQVLNNAANAGQKIPAFESLLQGIPTGVSFFSGNIDKGYVAVTFDVDGAGSLSKLLATIINSGQYKSVEMNSLTYRFGSGFQVELFLNN